MRDLLLELRELDPTTYNRAFDWLKNVIWDLIKDDPEGYFLEDGPYPLRDALLQVVLQEVITANGWYYCAWNGGADIVIEYGKDEPDVYTSYANPEAKSLLGAYIQAKESECGE